MLLGFVSGEWNRSLARTMDLSRKREAQEGVSMPRLFSWIPDYPSMKTKHAPYVVAHDP